MEVLGGQQKEESNVGDSYTICAEHHGSYRRAITLKEQLYPWYEKVLGPVLRVPHTRVQYYCGTYTHSTCINSTTLPTCTYMTSHMYEGMYTRVVCSVHAHYT